MKKFVKKKKYSVKYVPMTLAQGRLMQTDCYIQGHNKTRQHNKTPWHPCPKTTILQTLYHQLEHTFTSKITPQTAEKEPGPP